MRIRLENPSNDNSTECWGILAGSPYYRRVSARQCISYVSSFFVSHVSANYTAIGYDFFVAAEIKLHIEDVRNSERRKERERKKKILFFLFVFRFFLLFLLLFLFSFYLFFFYFFNKGNTYREEMKRLVHGHGYVTRVRRGSARETVCGPCGDSIGPPAIGWRTRLRKCTATTDPTWCFRVHWFILVIYIFYSARERA